MGDLVVLTRVRRPPARRRIADDERRGEIALFTGVRVERWGESGGEKPAPRDPRPRAPRRRRDN